MKILSPRQIRSRQATRFLPDLLQSVFVKELLVPSEELWLVSPWISDIPIINNGGGEFSSLVPEWDRTLIRLSQVILYLSGHLSHIHITTNNEKHNIAFIQAVHNIGGHNFGTLSIKQSDFLHEKGLLGKDYFLSGSFNLTYYGITLNDEIAHLYVDPAIVAENRIAFRERWKETS
ncbi:phospholipase D-like domain-containing protein DpdK [Chloroflexota bacterium]